MDPMNVSKGGSFLSKQLFITYDKKIIATRLTEKFLKTGAIILKDDVDAYNLTFGCI